MCSVTDDYEDSVECMEKETSKSLIGALCKKCQENKAEIVLRLKDVYCRHCFIESFTHKFRAALGKSKMLKPNDRILIALSGSPSSVALVHLVKEGIDITSPKRLQCIPHIVYIDEGAALGHTFEQRKEISNSVGEVIEKYGIIGYITSLDKCLNAVSKHSKLYEELNGNTIFHINEEGDMQVEALFAQLKSLTSKENLLQKLRHRLLFSIAEVLGCSKIFVADCATDLAVSIMANLSLGRGAQLPYDVGFCDTRHDKIKLLRPMRDFLKKEIAYYNVFKNIESHHYPTMLTKVDPFSSVQKLTEKFITELQNEFPSTVSTIFRTGDKLTNEGAGSDSHKTCALCEAPLDTSKQISSSLQATEFSQLISSANFSDANTSPSADAASEVHREIVASTTEDTTGCCNQQCSCASQQELKELDFNQIKDWLCYGCRLIVKEMDSIDYLPSDVISSVKTEIMQQQLRKEIQDFLL